MSTTIEEHFEVHYRVTMERPDPLFGRHGQKRDVNAGWLRSGGKPKTKAEAMQLAREIRAGAHGRKIEVKVFFVKSELTEVK